MLTMEDLCVFAVLVMHNYCLFMYYCCVAKFYKNKVLCNNCIENNIRFPSHLTFVSPNELQIHCKANLFYDNLRMTKYNVWQCVEDSHAYNYV